VRQENAFTQRAVYLAYQTDCQRCCLREQCLASGAKGDRARRVSAVRRLLPPPATVSRNPVMLGPMRWVDVAGRALRRTWTAHWRRQYVEVLPLAPAQLEAKPPPRPARAVRQASSLEVAGSARTQRLVGTTAMACHSCWCSRFSGYELSKEELTNTEAVSRQCPIPLSGSGGQRIPVCFQHPPSLPQGFLAMPQQFYFVPKP